MRGFGILGHGTEQMGGVGTTEVMLKAWAVTPDMFPGPAGALILFTWSGHKVGAGELTPYLSYDSTFQAEASALIGSHSAAFPNVTGAANSLFSVSAYCAKPSATTFLKLSAVRVGGVATGDLYNVSLVWR